MKLRIFFLLMMICALSSFGQQSDSPWNYISIKKQGVTHGTPVLSIGSVTWSDENKNGMLEGGEEGAIVLSLKNKGNGPAYNVSISTSLNRQTDKINFTKTQSIATLAAGQYIQVRIPIKAAWDISNDSVAFQIRINSVSGIQPEELTVKLRTKFNAPSLKYLTTSLKSSSDKFLPGENIALEVVMKNTGVGPARNVSLLLALPEDVICLDNISVNSKLLEASDVFKATFILIVKHSVKTDDLLIRIKANADNCNLIEDVVKIKLNSYSSSRIVRIEPTKAEVLQVKSTPGIESLISDVDRDIPVSGSARRDRAALIIGNQNYVYYNDEVKSISNVDFAVNDAVAFSEYARKVLCIEPSNIITLVDVTAGKMSAAIERMRDLLSSSKDSVELFVY